MNRFARGAQRAHAHPIRSSRARAIAAALAGGVVVAAPAAYGSGFAVPELSAAGLGTANAMVANPTDRGAIPYNPAAMGFHAQSSLALGVLFLDPSFSVRNAAGTSDSAGADWFAAPMGQAAVKFNERWSAGLGINAPFGLETRWPIGTFPALTNTARVPSPPFPPGTRIPLSPQPTQSKLEIVTFTPTGTYRVGENLALSAGADVYWAKSAQLNSAISAIEGDGTGVGFNLSALYVKDAISIGANFHSAATVAIEGTYSALNQTLVALRRQQPSQPAKLDLSLPWRLQVGVRYQFTSALAAEIDWTRTGWSEFERITVRGTRGGPPLSDDANEWEDANAYRLGLTWQVRDNTQLRFGYTYDESGQPDEYYSARIPDSDRQLFGIGVGQTFAGGWQVDAGYMYVMFDDRDFRASRRYPGNGAAINGTSALDGSYEASAHLIGIEVSKSFDLF